MERQLQDPMMHNTCIEDILEQFYHKTPCISCTKSQYLNISRLVLQLSLPNALKPGVKSSVKM